MRKIYTLLIWGCLLNFSVAHAQLVVKGVVRDGETSEVLPGCSVTLLGTTQGTVTSADGTFQLSVPNAQARLVFDFIGYTRQERQVQTKSPWEVVMLPSANELKELIVVGYGSTASKDVTGAAKSIKSTDFNRGIINSPEQLLQGKAAGVHITASSGEPGAALNIQVRGPGGVRTGSTPLFVIDGLALDNSSIGGALNPLTFLNPEDIASIDVLKDASATAIYGARGANGVILITTKKGKSSSSQVQFSSSLGLSQLARKMPLFTAAEFREQLESLNGNYVDDGGNTDWQKEVTQDALTQNHNLTLSGGTGRFSYFSSFGLQQQQGIIRESQLDRYNGRINVTQKAWDDKLVIDAQLSLGRIDNDRPNFTSVLGAALSANPTYRPYDENGKLKFYPDGSNPLFTLSTQQDITKTQRIVANISPSLTLWKGWVYKVNLGIDQSRSDRDIQTLPSADPFLEGGLQTLYNTNANRLIENYLTYTRQSNLHHITALVGHSYQKIDLRGRSYSINRFPVNGIEPLYNPGFGQDLTLLNNRPTGFAIINELQSFFTRVNYAYADKYLVTATLRADGSSKFGANNKYGLFPSFSFGWRISDEAFLQNSAFNELKLRIGYGITGNQEIPSKITQARFTSSVTGSTSYPLENTNTYPAGTTFARLANPNIQWETSAQIDLGIDYGIWNNAFSGSLDFFRKVSQDILLEVIPADPVQPAGTFWTNVADMSIINQGIEWEGTYRGGRGNKRWEIGANITFLDNTVRNSPYTVIPTGSASGSGLTSATINGYLSGQPIGTFYLREFIGFDEKGQSRYRDTNGDGVVTDNDRIAAGSALPKVIYNLLGNWTYKNFDFSWQFNGVWGNKVYDNTANALFYKVRLARGLNTTPEAVQFQEESVNNSAPVSTRFLKSGAYFRLNNLQVGYQLPTQKLGINSYISSLRIHATAQNLFVITPYNGFDPDVNTERNVNGISSYGIDYLTYPKARTFVAGLQIGF
ncbi:MAG: SusC/RagA family TonB-linked outer membrane protein [Spirosomataceae bacterium]